MITMSDFSQSLRSDIDINNRYHSYNLLIQVSEADDLPASSYRVQCQISTITSAVSRCNTGQAVTTISCCTPHMEGTKHVATMCSSLGSALRIQYVVQYTIFWSPSRESKSNRDELRARRTQALVTGHPAVNSGLWASPVQVPGSLLNLIYGPRVSA